MNSIIQKDLYRYIGNASNSLLQRIRYVFFVPGFQYIYIYRKCQLSKIRIIKLFWLILLKLCSFWTKIQIPYSTVIAEGFRIVHFGNIVINPDARIGKNFNIAQGCLVGNSKGKVAGVPVIGNNVCMNANSIVIGGIRIGDDVLIAPGAFVNFDVPDNSIVIGNPGKIINRNSSPTQKYIVYPI